VNLPERRHHADLSIPGVTASATGLEVTDTALPFDVWERVGAHFGALRDVTAFCLGDWYLAGEGLYGEAAAQGVEATGRTKGSLLECIRVARRVPRERRRETLSWSFHQAVASREPAEQVEWLDRAEANGWSIEEFRGMLRDDPATANQIGAENRALTAAEVELLVGVARELLVAVEPLPRGRSSVPDDVLARLANAVGESWPPPSLRLIEVDAKSNRPEWA
jgi:hypothetical protein